MSVAPLPDPDATAPPNLTPLPTAADAPEPGRDREAAYLLWSGPLHRNARAVAEKLGIPPRTVQRWATEDGWSARADREATELRAAVHAAAKVALSGAISDAIATLHRAARGEGGTKRVYSEKQGKVLEVDDPVPWQARVNASTALLDRFGIAPTTKHIFEPQPEPPSAVTLTPQAAAALSQEERSRRKREYEEAYAAKARGEEPEPASA